MICALGGCSRALDLRVELQAPASDNPFASIEVLESFGRVDGRLLALGGGRWDQGPLPLATRLPIDADRLLVIGRDIDGAVVAAGVSGALDLLASDDDLVTLRFTRTGSLSALDISLVPRPGGFVAPWGAEELLVFGGTDPQGCRRTDTEIVGLQGLRAGPVFEGGRTDAQFTLTTDGRLVVAGGRQGCGQGEEATSVWVASPSSEEGRLIEAPAIPLFAGLAAVGPKRVFWLGGERQQRPISEVGAIDIDTGRTEIVGQLDGPRSRAATLVDGSRIILLGGQSGTSTASILADATVFVPAQGRALSERIALGEQRAEAAAVAFPSGNLVMAGGVAGAAAPRSVQTIEVGSERDVPLGRSIAFTALSTVASNPHVYDLKDGTLFVTSQEGLHWVQTLPRSAVQIETPPQAQGPLRGGRLPDGLLFLVDDAGQAFTFNPGVAAFDPVALSGGDLSVSDDALGLIPRDPTAWLRTSEGLFGQSDRDLESDLAPREWVLLGEQSFQDFQLQTDQRRGQQGRAALIWGFSGPRDFDFVRLSGTAVFGRLVAGRRQVIACPSLSLSEFSVAQQEQVRLTRRGSRLELDLGADGQSDLICDTETAPAGAIGFGVVTQDIAFRSVSYRSL